MSFRGRVRVRTRVSFLGIHLEERGRGSLACFEFATVRDSSSRVCVWERRVRERGRREKRERERESRVRRREGGEELDA